MERKLSKQIRRQNRKQQKRKTIKIKNRNKILNQIVVAVTII